MENSESKLLVPSLALAIAGLLGSGLSMAAEIDSELRLGYITSDNIRRTNTNELSEFIWTAGMSLNISEETNRVLADVRGIVDYLEYDDAFSSETVSGLDAFVELTMIDERLSWVVRDNFGQRLSDPFKSPAPGNREDINFFSTGPNLEFPIGSRHYFDAEARYSTVTYEISPDDNDRVSGLLQLGRRLNSESTISLNVSAESVEYTKNDSLATDFDIAEAFIAYQLLATRNVIGVDAGYTEVDDGLDKLDGYLLRLNWTRITSESQRLLFSAGSEYSSQGDIFRYAQSNGREIGDTVDTEVTDAPFRSNFFFTRYNLDRSRTRIAIEAEWLQEDYGSPTPTGPGGTLEALDRDVARISLSVERDISRNIFGDFGLIVRTRDYKYIDRNDDDFSIKLGLGYRISQGLNVEIKYQYFDRDSNNDSSSFTENKAMIGIAYIPTWGR